MLLRAGSLHRGFVFAFACLAALAGGRPAPLAIAAPDERAASVAWEAWTSAAFDRARRERKPVLVEVAAGWCHWCHVMERTTYADPRVVARLGASFVAIRVDADARPDLAERFAEYRWPATVFLSADARPIAALRGYRAPDDFVGVLDRVLDAARRGVALEEVLVPAGTTAVAAAGTAFLAPFRARLLAALERAHDARQGGWGRGQKYPHAAPVVHALRESLRPGAAAAWRARALAALAGAEALIDPVEGGMFQYSEGGVWTRPHHEKIVPVEAGAISAYAAAFRATRDPRWLRDAREVRRHLATTLRAPSGAFYASQDADAGGAEGRAYYALDAAGRRRVAAPRVDRSIYAQENGLAVRALCDLFAAAPNPDDDTLSDAVRAADAVLAGHRDPRGGYRHAVAGTASGASVVLHLGDQVAMGRALLALHQVTGDPRWWAEASSVADFLLAAFLDRERGGFFATTDDPGAPGVFRERVKPFEGNASAARFLLGLDAVADRGPWRAEALRALQAISDPGLAERLGPRVGECLLAVEEAAFPWVRVTVVGAAGDAAAEALWRAALALDLPLAARARAAPGGAPAAGGDAHPPTPSPAAYLCGDGRCSPPVTRPEDLPAAARDFAPR